MTVRVVVVDDETLVRAGLRVLLESENDLQIVGEAADGTEASSELARRVGKAVLVVGATSGIGATVARRVAAEGAAVVAAGRRTELGEHLVTEIRGSGGEALFLICDATVEDDVAAAVHAARATFGHRRGAVNNAGGVLAPGPLDQVSGRAWHEELELNLRTAFYGSAQRSATQ